VTTAQSFINSLRPMSRHESWFFAGEIVAALLGQQTAVDADIADEHVESGLEGIADDFALFYVHTIRKGNTIGQSPRVALAGNCPKLVDDREPFFMRGDDCGKEFTSKFVPEMIEEILRRAADAAVVVRRPEHDDLRRVNALLKGRETWKIVGDVRIVEGERFFFEIQHIDRAAISAQALGDVLNNGARNGLAVQAAGDGEDA
jgi:hypothetical protein